jgi:hypothetical protein
MARVKLTQRREQNRTKRTARAQAQRVKPQRNAPLPDGAQRRRGRGDNSEIQSVFLAFLCALRDSARVNLLEMSHQRLNSSKGKSRRGQKGQVLAGVEWVISSPSPGDPVFADCPDEFPRIWDTHVLP